MDIRYIPAVEFPKESRSGGYEQDAARRLFCQADRLLVLELHTDIRIHGADG